MLPFGLLADRKATRPFCGGCSLLSLAVALLPWSATSASAPNLPQWPASRSMAREPSRAESLSIRFCCCCRCCVSVSRCKKAALSCRASAPSMTRSVIPFGRAEVSHAQTNTGARASGIRCHVQRMSLRFPFGSSTRVSRSRGSCSQGQISNVQRVRRAMRAECTKVHVHAVTNDHMDPGRISV